MFDIVTEVVPVVAVLNAIGALIKKSGKVQNWQIVFILCGAGILGAGLVLFGKSGWDFNAVNIAQIIVQGIMCGLTAVGAHQAVKQGSLGIHGGEISVELEEETDEE